MMPMSAIIKYIIFIIIFISSIFFYLFYTPLGNQQVYSTVGYILSKKVDLHVKVTAINVQKYPYIEANMIVEEKYHLQVQGNMQNGGLDMDYQLTATCLQSDVCTIEDEIDILGHIKGPDNNLYITGKGKALDGNVSYDMFKQSEQFKDLNIVINDMNSSKLFALFDQTALFKGKADAKIHFDYLGEESKKGLIIYDVKDENFSGLPVSLHAQIAIDNMAQTFIMEVTAPELTFNLTQGRYDEEKKYAHAFYSLDIKELSALEALLENKYIGPFSAFGELEYDKHMRVKGLSKSLGGLVDFLYEKESLQLELDAVPLTNITQRLSYTALLNANVTGKITYDFATQTTTAKTKLQDATFLPSELVDTLSEKSGINLATEVFNDSHLDLVYKEDRLHGDILFSNTKHRLSLRDTKVNLTKKSIETMLDLQTQNYKIAGKTYLAMLDEATPMQNALQDTYLRFNGTFNTHYKVTLNGLVNDSWINMDYTLKTKRFPSHICTIEDDVDMAGHLNGPFSQLRISGKGKALNGTFNYDGTKSGDSLEDLTLSIKNIHALKLSTLLGQTTFPHGRADLEANFDYLSKARKKGNLTYTFKKGTLSKLPFTMQTQIAVENEKQTFEADITLANAKINITKGLRNADQNLTTAFYVIDVKDLSVFEDLLGFKYYGPLYAMGESTFTEHLSLQGVSKTFGGMLDFVYQEDKLDIDLDAVSFKRFMSLFPYPILLDADATGKINYNFAQKKMTVKTDLNHAKFLSSEMVSSIYKKANVNMLVEEFDDSTLEVTYQNSMIQGNLKLANDTSHFSLTNTKLNTDKNTIDAYFDFKMQDQEFSGKVYGSMDNPKVNLNMQKLIRHKMDEQMDSMVGKGNREMMESMPMGETAKDVASGVAGGFMGIFF